MESESVLSSVGLGEVGEVGEAIFSNISLADYNIRLAKLGSSLSSSFESSSLNS